MFQGSADVGRGADGGNACRLQRAEFVRRRAFAAGDNRAGMPHAFARRGGNARDVGDDGFVHVRFDVFGRFFFGGAADFADHDDAFGLRVGLEGGEDVHEAGAVNRVATNTNAGGLAEADAGGLVHGFVGQRAGSGDDADHAGLVNVAGHDAHFAFAGGDDAGAVRPDEADVRAAQGGFDFEHVQHRDAFGDAGDDFNAGIDRLKDGVGGKCGRHEDHRGVGAGRGDGFVAVVEDRAVEVALSAFAGGNAADELGAVSNRLFAVEGAL